jgi:Ca2+-binding RTX toxin-like protein
MKALFVATAGLVLGFSIGFYLGAERVPFIERGWAILDSAGRSALIAHDGTPSNDHLVGAAGDDGFEGKAGDDLIEGGQGNDTIYGGEGNDQLHGDGGSDKLIGEGGSDRLWGGAGSDWFVLKGSGALVGVDRIEDFEDGVDHIVLEKLGVSHYESSGANGTVFARKVGNDNVLHIVTSSAQELLIEIAIPAGANSATEITADDFIFD